MSGPRALGEQMGLVLAACWRVSLATAGAAALLWGTAQWSPPAAACVAGAGMLALSLSRRRKT
jgi:hypothetical protein